MSDNLASLINNCYNCNDGKSQYVIVRDIVCSTYAKNFIELKRGVRTTMLLVEQLAPIGATCGISLEQLACMWRKISYEFVDRNDYMKHRVVYFIKQQLYVSMVYKKPDK